MTSSAEQPSGSPPHPARDGAARPRCDRRRTSPRRLWAVLLALYVLSIGPMYWVWYEAVFVNGSRWIAAFYQPLRLIASLPIVGRLIEDYIYMWIVLLDWFERWWNGR